MKFSERLRNARLAAIGTTIGGAPLLTIHEGPPPASLDDLDTGPALVAMTLPQAWLANPTGGMVQMLSEWSHPKAANSGRAGHFRLRSADNLVDLQGTVTAEGKLGDMEIDSVDIVRGQTVTVRSFILIDGNA